MTLLSEEEKDRLKRVYNALPKERLGVYLEASGRNPYAALKRYDENSKLSSSLFEVVGHFEVSLRNTLDTALSSRHQFKKRSGDWLDDAHGEFTDRASEALQRAKEDAVSNRRAGAVSTRGHIIAELNLSFWRRLLDARYERVHGSAVMRFFPRLRMGNYSDMGPLRDLVDPAYAMRNRIAHHEPIWQSNWVKRHAEMLEVLEHSSPELADWVRLNCLLPRPVQAPVSPPLF